MAVLMAAVGSVWWSIRLSRSVNDVGRTPGADWSAETCRTRLR